MAAEQYSPTEEITQIRSETSRLESLEGYNKLTDYQQRLIKASLYIQARAERGTDFSSNFAIESAKNNYVTDETRILSKESLDYMFKSGSGPNPALRKYESSQNFIGEWYCHAAIAALEAQSSISAEPSTIPENFFEAEYRIIRAYQQAQDLIDAHGYPCVVHIALSQPANFNEGHNTVAHSFLALGKNEEGNIIIWDKKNFELPFRTTTLQNVYDTYGPDWVYGVRDLRTLKQETETDNIY